jgi:sn-glycerol 3-phosphate transport system substrate-binding protein
MKRILALVTTLAIYGIANAQTDIQFWYTFSDENRAGWIQARMAEFNEQLAAEGKPYQIVGESKGSYAEVLNAAVLAARQGTPPHLVQIYEIGSQTALDTGIFAPVGSLGEFDTSDYIAPVLNYYTIAGQVNSIPFNSSSPIIYANKTLMDAAGVSEVPQTYGAMIEACDFNGGCQVLWSQREQLVLRAVDGPARCRTCQQRQRTHRESYRSELDKRCCQEYF